MKRVVNASTRYACLTKRTYSTFSDAKKFARITTRDASRAVEPYACPICGKFHVGTGEPRYTKLQKRKPRYEPTIEDNLAEWE